jgi:hypothetical protein
VSDDSGTGVSQVSGRLAFEKKLSEAAADEDALGAARLRYVLDSIGSLSLRQTAFDCLEVWGDHPHHIEPLYAAGLLFFENDDVHLALMAVEFAMTILVKSPQSKLWPYHAESVGWQLDLLYARLLVRKDRVSEAMAYYGPVLVRCDDAVRHTIKSEVMLASQRLHLCNVKVS